MVSWLHRESWSVFLKLLNGYINPCYWVDDHPLLYGNNGSLDPGTYSFEQKSRDTDNTSR